MRFDDREALETYDPHTLLFGDDHDEHHDVTHVSAGGARSDRRSVHRHRRRRRRRRGILLVVALCLLALVAASGYFVVRPYLAPKDWSGQGSGTVSVQVQPGDGADAIGASLAQAGVVRTAAAFTRAAANNSKSSGLQPGTYTMRKHMSGANALNLMLAPGTRVVNQVTVPEGTIWPDVMTKLAAALKVPVAQVQAAAKNVSELNLPDNYAPSSGKLTSTEGFLWPDTYEFDPGTTPTAALEQMVSEFVAEDRSIGFADAAQRVGLSPYAALTIASIIQSEVKFAADGPKVARVVLNRLAGKKNLQIDATSVYAAELAGLNPNKVNHATIDSPYNTYMHPGLPPTPIGNPGESSLKSATNPAAGDWLWYVNIDAAGHLGFFDNEATFEVAVTKCQANNWGCG